MTPLHPRVLLIEDGPTYAKLATLLLTICGCDVVRTATAADGIRLARKERPDLVLLDMHLPDGEGAQVVRTLRGDERTRRLLVVGMTADRIYGEEEQRAARLAGFDAYLEKPTDEGAFRRLVESFLPPSPTAG